MDFLLPELVEIVIAERRSEAGSLRESRMAASQTSSTRLRPRLAAILGAAAAHIHSEAARAAVGLRRVPHLRECDRPAECRSTLCLCED